MKISLRIQLTSQNLVLTKRGFPSSGGRVSSGRLGNRLGVDPPSQKKPFLLTSPAEGGGPRPILEILTAGEAPSGRCDLLDNLGVNHLRPQRSVVPNLGPPGILGIQLPEILAGTASRVVEHLGVTVQEWRPKAGL